MHLVIVEVEEDLDEDESDTSLCQGRHQIQTLDSLPGVQLSSCEEQVAGDQCFQQHSRSDLHSSVFIDS